MLIATTLVFTVHCPNNLSLSNGYVKYSLDLSLVDFHCISGYQLDGSPSATCNEDGTWSSPTPKCAGVYDNCSDIICNASKMYPFIVIVVISHIILYMG